MRKHVKTINVKRGIRNWQDDFSADLNEKGEWVCSLSYVCYQDELMNLLPATGSPCPITGFEYAGLESREVELHGPELYWVTCKYSGIQEDEGEEGGDNPPVDKLLSTWEFSAAATQKPLGEHPMFKEALKEDAVRNAIEGIKSFRYRVEGSGSETKIIRMDPKDLPPPASLPEEAVKFIEYMNKGVESYFKRTCSYSTTTRSSRTGASGGAMDSVLAGLVSAAGGDFRKVSENTTKTYGNKRQTETRTDYTQNIDDDVTPK